MSIKKKNQNSKLRLSIDEKIKLFKEVGEPITGSTVYKGYKIGQLAIMLRSNLKKGRVTLSKKQQKELNKLGILEPQGAFDTQKEKVKRLAAFAQNYPDIWRNKHCSEKALSTIENEEERRNIAEKLKDAEECYRYLYVRKRGNHLTESELNLLIVSGVGGTFGYTKEIEDDKENIIKKYGIEERKLDLIIRRYGSIDAFRKKYIESLINGKVRENIPNEILEKFNLVNGFDLSKPDFISRDNRYVEFIIDIFEIQDEGLIVNGEGVKKSVEESLKNLSQIRSEILHRIYGLNVENKESLRSITSEYGVTTQALSLTKLGGIRDLKQYQPSIMENIYDLDNVTREAFIREYFSKHDIFYGEDVEELDEQTSKNLFHMLILPRILKNTKYNEFVENFLKDDILNVLRKENKHDNLKDIECLAREIVDSITQKLDDFKNSNDTVKNGVYENFYKKTDFIRIMIEAQISFLGKTEKSAVKEWKKDIEKIINENFGDDITRKNELLEALNSRIQYIANKNRQYFLSKINEDFVDGKQDENSDDYVENFEEYTERYEQLEFEINASYLEESDRIELLEIIEREKSNPKFQIKQQKMIIRKISEIMHSKAELHDSQINDVDGLSVRAKNCLPRAGIFTVGEWLQLSEDEKRKIKNLGVKTKEELEAKITLFYENFINQKRLKVVQMINISYLDSEVKLKLLKMLNKTCYEEAELDDENCQSEFEIEEKTKENQQQNNSESFDEERKSDSEINQELADTIENLKQAYSELEKQLEILQGRKLKLQDEENQIELKTLRLREEIDSLSQIVQKHYRSVQSVPSIKKIVERLREAKINLEIEKRKKANVEERKSNVEKREQQLNEKKDKIKQAIDDIELTD